MSKGIITTEQRQKQLISRLISDNKKLRIRIGCLEEQLATKDKALETVLLRLAELEEIIFGKSKKKDQDKDDQNKSGGNKSSPRPDRNKSSYIRPAPSQAEVTATEEHDISNCPDCGTKLTRKEIITRYVEDISLACLDALGKDKEIKKIKKVIKQKITKGYCPKCQKWHSAIPLSSKITRAGPNVGMFTAYAVNILRLSYEQTKNLLADLYNFPISDGEITNLLARTSIKLSPELARLKQRILTAKSVHLDETGWLTGGKKNYGWVMASGDTEEAVFLIGKNRGKGNAQDLLENYADVRVTDCYSGYKNLKGTQAVCWSHVIRKFRDLKNNANLKEAKKNFAAVMYGEASALYEKVKFTSQAPFIKTERLKIALTLKRELNGLVKKILANQKQSVKKMIDLAKLLRAYREQLFICVTHEGVATTNNKAERKLRHIVLKRKNCFGSKTEKGNMIMEINLSVLLSLWWNNREQFFPKFKELMDQGL